MNSIQQLQQYIEGKMSEADLDAATKVLVKDYFEKEDLVQRWEQLLHNPSNSSIAPPSQVITKNNWRKWIWWSGSIAAGILFLVFSWMTYNSLSTPSYQRLVSEAISQPYIETLSRKGQLEELRLQAIDFYNRKEYAQASLVFQQLNSQAPKIDWTFYIGLCQLYQDKPKAAIDMFQQVLEQPNKFDIEANWYLGLAFAADQQLKKALPHLEVVRQHAGGELGWKVKEAKALMMAIEAELRQNR